jgi:hypothetical protein
MLSDILAALGNLLALINTYTPTIQTIILLIALIYAASQTRGLLKQLSGDDERG